MKTFITEIEGHEGPQIDAFDFGHARQQAWGIPGLEVSGELVLTIQKEGFTDKDADRICKALSEDLK